MSAKKITGAIYKRGKEGRYYLRYKLKGVSYNVALKDDNGQPVTDERTAIKAKDAIINPLNAGTEAKRLENVISKLQAAEVVVSEAAVRAEADEKARKNKSLTLADGWRLFMDCKHRPASCKKFTYEELEQSDGGRLINRNTTAGNYRAYYLHFVEWLKTHRPDVVALADVTADMAETFMKQLGKTGSEGTFNKYQQFLRLFFDVLITDGKIFECENPFKEIERKKGEYYSKSELTIQQVEDIINHTDGELRVMLYIGYFTGLRLGDCCTLLWNNVDLDRLIIKRTPRKTAERVKDKAVPVVKIGVAPYLAGLLAELPQNGPYVLPHMARMYLGGKKDVISRQITAAFEAAGIETRRERDGGGRAVVVYGFHSLRYTYISQNAESGVPQAVIQANAGHKNKAMTEHYEKISDDAARKYASRLTLPSPKKEAVVEGEIIHDDEVETDDVRSIMKSLAEILPIEVVQEIVHHYKMEEA